MHSSTLPQRMSLATSRPGASPWWTPSWRMLAAIAWPISVIRSGEKLPPQTSGPGKVVAPAAMSPTRHSSCAIAGIPNRDRATRSRWKRASARAPSAATTGLVPNVPGQLARAHCD